MINLQQHQPQEKFNKNGQKNKAKKLITKY